MSNEKPNIELAQSQVQFAANLVNGAPKRSDYMNTNFSVIKKVREMHLEDQDYDVHKRNTKLDLGDYYAGLRANDENIDHNEGNLFLKANYKSNILLFLSHCVLLLVALICGSSVGVFYYNIQPQSQLLKSSWRMLFLAICISPLTIMEYMKGKERFVYSKEVLWNADVLKKILFASIGHAIWTIALVIAVNHTSIAQASLLINIHPIMLMLFKFKSRSSFLHLEKAGGICVIIGTLLVFFDSNIESTGGLVNLNNIDSLTRNTSGNLIALIGAVGGAFYFTKNQELKDGYPFFLGIFMISILGFIFISVISLITEGATISFDPDVGIFGLFSGERIGIYILIIIVTGFGAYIGYAVSLQYFQPLLVSTIFNIEPIFATLLVYFLGWQSFPAMLTLIAFCLIIPGTILVTLGNREVEVREYDILNENDFNSINLLLHARHESRTGRTMSILKHYKTSSAVAPISWEK